MLKTAAFEMLTPPESPIFYKFNQDFRFGTYCI